MFDLKQYKYLFLDRDGVINIERPNDYVKSEAEFVFIDETLDAIQKLSTRFDKIIVITNQRGVGRNVMSIDSLDIVHKHMTSEISRYGGRIDNIYFCTDICNTSINRKPNIGMGFQAQRDFSEIDFSKSIMVGNSKSDIEFGNKLGMLTVLVGDKYSKEDTIYRNINVYCENLSKFVELMQI